MIARVSKLWRFMKMKESGLGLIVKKQWSSWWKNFKREGKSNEESIVDDYKWVSAYQWVSNQAENIILIEKLEDEYPEF